MKLISQMITQKNLKKFTDLVLSLDQVKYEEDDYKKIFDLIQKNSS